MFHYHRVGKDEPGVTVTIGLGDNMAHFHRRMCGEGVAIAAMCIYSIEPGEVGAVREGRQVGDADCPVIIQTLSVKAIEVTIVWLEYMRDWVLSNPDRFPGMDLSRMERPCDGPIIGTETKSDSPSSAATAAGP